MATQRLHRRYVFFAAALIATGVVLSVAYADRDRFSGATILGRWNGYFPQIDATGRVAHFPLAMIFRPDGLVQRGYGRSDANYLVHGHVLVFYNIRSSNAPRGPVVWDASLVGDTLTIGTGKDAAVLKRAQ